MMNVTAGGSPVHPHGIHWEERHAARVGSDARAKPEWRPKHCRHGSDFWRDAKQKEHKSTRPAKWRPHADLEDGHGNKENRREDSEEMGLAHAAQTPRPCQQCALRRAQMTSWAGGLAVTHPALEVAILDVRPEGLVARGALGARGAHPLMFSFSPA